jgi:hypothetical protein
MRPGGALALAAGLLLGVPHQALAGQGAVLWVGLCDTEHPARRIPIPLDRDGDGGSGKACHASCSVLPDRRARR